MTENKEYLLRKTRYMFEFHHHRFKYPPRYLCFVVVVGFVWSDDPDQMIPVAV
jgi:hypothetical protein